MKDIGLKKIEEREEWWDNVMKLSKIHLWLALNVWVSNVWQRQQQQQQQQLGML